MANSKDTSSKSKKKIEDINWDLQDAMTDFRISCRNGILKNVLFSMRNALAISVANDEQGISSKMLLSILVLSSDSCQTSALSSAMDGGHESIVEFFMCLLFTALFEKLDPNSIHYSLSLNDWSTEVFGSIHPKLKSGWLKRLGRKSGFDSMATLLEEKKYTVNAFLKNLGQYLDDMADDKNLLSLSSSLDTVLSKAKNDLHYMKSTRSKVLKPKINLKEYSNRYDVLDDEFDEDIASSSMEDSFSTESNSRDPTEVVMTINFDHESCHGIITDNETEVEEEVDAQLSSEKCDDECDWDLISCSDMDDFEEVQYSFKDALARSEKAPSQPDSFIFVDNVISDDECTIDIDRGLELQLEQDSDFDRSGYKHISKGRFYKNDRSKRDYMRKVSKRTNVLVQE